MLLMFKGTETKFTTQPIFNGKNGNALINKISKRKKKTFVIRKISYLSKNNNVIK